MINCLYSIYDDQSEVEKLETVTWVIFKKSRGGFQSLDPKSKKDALIQQIKNKLSD